MKNLGLLLLRVVTGLTLIAHGYSKLFGGDRPVPEALAGLFGPNFRQQASEGGPEAVGDQFANLGIPYPHLGAYLAGAAEFGGGLALLTGTMTRWAALAVAVNMATAIGKVHWKNGLVGEGGYEYPAQLLAEAGTLFLAGPGAISVDGLVGGVRAGAKGISRGSDSLGKAVSKAKKRGSQAVGQVSAQAQDLPLPF